MQSVRLVEYVSGELFGPLFRSSILAGGIRIVVTGLSSRRTLVAGRSKTL